MSPRCGPLAVTAGTRCYTEPHGVAQYASACAMGERLGWIQRSALNDLDVSLLIVRRMIGRRVAETVAISLRLIAQCVLSNPGGAMMLRPRTVSSKLLLRVLGWRSMMLVGAA